MVKPKMNFRWTSSTSPKVTWIKIKIWVQIWPFPRSFNGKTPRPDRRKIEGGLRSTKTGRSNRGYIPTSISKRTMNFARIYKMPTRGTRSSRMGSENCDRSPFLTSLMTRIWTIFSIPATRIFHRMRLVSSSRVSSLWMTRSRPSAQAPWITIFSCICTSVKTLISNSWSHLGKHTDQVDPYLEEVFKHIYFKDYKFEEMSAQLYSILVNANTHSLIIAYSKVLKDFVLVSPNPNHLIISHIHRNKRTTSEWRWRRCS